MGTSGRRRCRPAPSPLLHHLPGGGARPIGPGPGGWDSGSRPGGRARARAAGAARGGRGARPPPSQPAPRPGWGPEVLLARLPEVPQPAPPAGVPGWRVGARAGCARGGRRRHRKLRETRRPLPGSGQAGSDKLGPPARDYPADRRPERNAEGGGGGVIKMLRVPAGDWRSRGAALGSRTPDPALRTLHLRNHSLFAVRLAAISCNFRMGFQLLRRMQFLKGRNWLLLAPVTPAPETLKTGDTLGAGMGIGAVSGRPVGGPGNESPYLFGRLECVKNPHWLGLPERLKRPSPKELSRK